MKRNFSLFAMAVVLELALAVPGSAAQVSTGDYVTTIVSHFPEGTSFPGAGGARISPDGRYVAFAGASLIIIPGLFIRDLLTAETSLITLTPGGLPIEGTATPGSFSRNSRYFVFMSGDPSLITEPHNGKLHIYVHDLVAGTNTLVSRANDQSLANNHCQLYSKKSISADGRYVVFLSRSTNLASDDTNGKDDVFVRDLVSLTTTRVSVSSSGAQASDWSVQPSISDDGRFVTFHSRATELVSGAGGSYSSIFLHDRATGSTEWISRSMAGLAPNGACTSAVISGNGNYIVYSSVASNLVPGDTNGKLDVFRHDRTLLTTERINLTMSGGQATESAHSPSITSDGRYVSFYSSAADLVQGDTALQRDVFVRDTALGNTRRVNISTSGSEANGDTTEHQMSDDGLRVVFPSHGSNLVPEDLNEWPDVFLQDASFTTPISYCIGKVNSLGCRPRMGFAGSPSLSGADDFFLAATNVVSQRPGLLFFGRAAAESPFFSGTLCSIAPFTRTLLQDSGGGSGEDCTGLYTFHFSQAFMSMHQLQPGARVFSQFWYRDTAHPDGTRVGLSNAVAFSIGL